MSLVIAPNGRFSAAMFQSAKELGRTSHHEEPQNRKSFNASETEITTKIDHIVGCLKELEEKLFKAKKELFKDSLLEGRENSKICAVQGKVIRNKDKYYNNLEQGVDALSQAFQDSWDKISREFKKLQNISKQKAVPQLHVDQKNLFSMEENEMCTHNISPPQTVVKDTKMNNPKFITVKEIKINSDSNRNSSPLASTFKFSSDHVQKIPKMISSQKIENLAAYSGVKHEFLNQDSSKFLIQKAKYHEEPVSPVAECAFQAQEKLSFEPLCVKLKKYKFYNDEENKSTSSGGFSDSNEEIFENDLNDSKSKRITSYFDDEPTLLSIDNPKHLQF